jgi:hypothetical protein
MSPSLLNPREVNRARSGPRQLKDPRSRAYAIQTVHALKRNLESQRIDEARVREELAEIDRYRHWEVLGYASRDALLEAEIGVTLTGIQARMRAAAENTDTDDLLPARRPVGRREINRQIADLTQTARATKVGISPRTQRTLDRLAREAPTFLDGYRVGKYRSVHAAAKAAGFVTTKTPLEQLRHWWTKATDAERQQFQSEILDSAV